MCIVGWIIFCFSIAGKFAALRGYSGVATFFKRFNFLLRWNILILLITMSLDEIIIYSSIEFSTISIHSFAMFFSIALIFTMLGVVGFLVFKSFKLIKSYQKLQKGGYNNSESQDKQKLEALADHLYKF